MTRRRSARILKRTNDAASKPAAEALAYAIPDPGLTREEAQGVYDRLKSTGVRKQFLVDRLSHLEKKIERNIAKLQWLAEFREHLDAINRERVTEVCPMLGHLMLTREPSYHWCRPRFGIYLLDYR